MRAPIRRSLAALTAAAALAAAPGCGRDDDDSITFRFGGTSRETVERDDVDAFEDRMRRRLDGLHGKLDRLGDDLRDATGEARVKLQRAADELRPEIDELERDLRRLREESRERWGELRDRLETGVVELERTFDEALR